MAGGKTPWENPTEIVTASEQCCLAPGGLTQAKRACWNVPLVLFSGAKLSHQRPPLFRGAPFGLVLDSESLQSLLQLLPFLGAADGGILPSHPCSYDTQFSFPATTLSLFTAWSCFWNGVSNAGVGSCQARGRVETGTPECPLCCVLGFVSTSALWVPFVGCEKQGGSLWLLC